MPQSYRPAFFAWRAVFFWSFSNDLIKAKTKKFSIETIRTLWVIREALFLFLSISLDFFLFSYFSWNMLSQNFPPSSINYACASSRSWKARENNDLRFGHQRPIRANLHCSQKIDCKRVACSKRQTNKKNIKKLDREQSLTTGFPGYPHQCHQVSKVAISQVFHYTI